MNKLILTVLAITAASLLFASENGKMDVTFTVEAVTAFNNWVVEHKKFYTTPEEKLYRLSIFIKTLKHIKAHNESISTYVQGLNAFSDMTFEEFTIKYTGDLSDDSFKSLGAPAQFNIEDALTQGAAVDWTTTGAVNPVQNQGQCGGCWSFAATASFETAYFKKFNTLIKFSEQAGLDCDNGNSGCGGGLPQPAMVYQQNFGYPKLSDYPYVARDQTCKLGTLKVSKSLSYVYNSPSSAELLKASVIQGVTYISVYANQNFMNYSSGIFSDPNCSTSQTNHAIGAVGFDANMTYWKVRNSWGPGWGEAGYIRMANLVNTYGTCYMFRRAAVVTDVTQYPSSG
jgi:cathepsin L